MRVRVRVLGGSVLKSREHNACISLYCNRRNVNFTVGNDFDPILAYVVGVCNGILSVHERK